jgi:NAD(P)-dependent dehydrogenase (short-subunit alcohol dehydrogenase family)
VNQKLFTDQVVLVTGAGRGLGRALSLAFGGEGARLAIIDLTPINLDQTEIQLKSSGVEVLSITGDVAKKMQVQGMIEATVEHFGRLDVLINHAHVEPVAALLTMDEWDWDRTLAVNLKGPFLTMQSAGRIMSEQGGGCVINLGLTRSLRRTDRAAFAASLKGLGELTRRAAIEFAPHRIRVNALAVSNVPDQAAADAALYLCSPDSSFITGEVLHLEGASSDPE